MTEPEPVIEPGPTPAGSGESRNDLAAVRVGTEIRVGHRVVVRYRIADGRATDALGTLLSASASHLVVDGKRGVETIPVADVIAAKEVPPPPERRRGQ